jgi:hypothetical protein
VEQHVAACASCRGRLSTLRAEVAEIDALVSLLPTVPAPTQLRVDAVIRRARRARRWWLSIAAALALMITTIAGATVARPYVEALVGRIRGVGRQPAGPSPHPVGQPGIAFVPGPAAEIAFDARQPRGTLRVSLADTSDLVIDPTAIVTYRVHPGGVIVHNRGSTASYTVIVPRRAPHVRIVVAGRLVFEKTGSDVAAGTAESAGGYTIDMR